MEIKDGNVVVIRDGDAVEGVFYREYYEEIGDFFDETNLFISAKKLKKPNVSYMKIVNNRFTPLKMLDGSFYDEWNTFALLLQVDAPHYCKTCKTPNFLYLFDSKKSFCPSCRK